MKLEQGQVWKVNDQFIRIVRLERLAVEFKEMMDLETSEGSHHRSTKKEFCRMIKKGELVSSASI